MSEKLDGEAFDQRLLCEIKCMMYEPEKCPRCGCRKLWKNGHAEGLLGTLQRYSCRKCALRFSKW